MTAAIYAASGEGPIVLLTSLDSDMNHILSLEMGASDYILKTTPPAVLLARLRLHLRQHIAVPDGSVPPRSPRIKRSLLAPEYRPGE